MYGNVSVHSDTIGLVSRSVSSLYCAMSHEGGNKVGIAEHECNVHML